MRERTLETRRVFDGRLIKVDVEQVELESGERSSREIVRHPGAVGVLGRLPDGRFVMVRQFRKAIEKDLLEIVAGTRDGLERPDACAVREMKEETGYDVEELSHLGCLYMAPGFSDERIDLFFAELSSEAGRQATDEDEKLEVVVLSCSEMEGLIERGEIRDGKTVAAWLLAKRRLNPSERTGRSAEG